MNDGHITYLPSLSVTEPGRYLVTIAIEPQLDPASLDPDSNNHLVSISLDGLYYRTEPSEESGGPQPVPWYDPSQAFAVGNADQLIKVDSKAVPFSYRSERTGYIRLGEVDLSPELNELYININLEGWLDEALSPILAEVSSRPSSEPMLDVSGQLEGYGLGLEKLFMLSKAMSF